MLTLWKATIVDANGSVQAGANVEVLAEASGAPAALFADNGGITPIGNPVTANSNGAVSFYAAEGVYRINITRDAFTRTWRNVPIGLSAAADSVHYLADVERDANVTPVNYSYPVFNVLRYGNNVSPGVTDMSPAFQAAARLGRIDIPPGEYRIETSITRTGALSVTGRDATLYSNVTTFVITDGSGSRISGLKFLPLSVPFTILRNPAAWTATPDQVVQSYNGYMPTSQDPDIWGSLSEQIKSQLAILRPGIYFKVSSSSGGRDVAISGITGYCTSIVLEGYTDSRIHDCNFGGNGATYGAIVLFNGVNRAVNSEYLGFTLPRGLNNRVYNCTIMYASLCGIVLFGQDEYAVIGCDSSYNGESGFKTYSYDGNAGPSETPACISTTGRIVGCKASANYYDGFDLSSHYGAPLVYFYRGMSVTGNTSFKNRHTGYIVTGAGLTISDNVAWSNGTHGICFVGWGGIVSGNQAQTNMTTGTTLVAQPFDIYVAGDDIVSYGNGVTNSNAPATYNYFHGGFPGSAPTSSHAGRDFGNYCSEGSARMYVHPAIPGAA